MTQSDLTRRLAEVKEHMTHLLATLDVISRWRGRASWDGSYGASAADRATNTITTLDAAYASLQRRNEALERECEGLRDRLNAAFIYMRSAADRLHRFPDGKKNERIAEQLVEAADRLAALSVAGQPGEAERKTIAETRFNADGSPRDWTGEEQDELVRAFDKSYGPHGLTETLFAVVNAWCRHHVGPPSQPGAGENENG